MYTKNPKGQEGLRLTINDHTVATMKEIAAIFGTKEEQAAEIVARYTLDRKDKHMNGG